MKWIQLVVIFAFTFMGCQKEPLDPIVDPVKITITASANNGVEIDPAGVKTIEVGTSPSYKLTIKDGYSVKSVNVDNNVNYTLSADNVLTLNNPTINTSIRVEGVLNNFLIATSKKWVTKKIESQLVSEGPFVFVTMEGAFYTDYCVFGKDKIFRRYDASNTLIGGPWNWGFTDDGNGLNIGTTSYQIVSFGENEIVLITPSSDPNQKILFRETWVPKE